MTDINIKLDNFKAFVDEVSRNKTIVDEYKSMSWFKVQALAYVLLIPQRDNLDVIAKEMQKKLDFDDAHLDKFKRYLSFFVEYLAPALTDSPKEHVELTYEQQLEKMMALHAHAHDA